MDGGTKTDNKKESRNAEYDNNRRTNKPHKRRQEKRASSSNLYGEALLTIDYIAKKKNIK